MQTLAVFCVLSVLSNSLPADTLTRDEAQAIAERYATDGGVNMSDFDVTQVRRERSGEWSFLFECKSRASQHRRQTR